MKKKKDRLLEHSFGTQTKKLKRKVLKNAFSIQPFPRNISMFLYLQKNPLLFLQCILLFSLHAAQHHTFLKEIKEGGSQRNLCQQEAEGK